MNQTVGTINLLYWHCPHFRTTFTFARPCSNISDTATQNPPEFPYQVEVFPLPYYYLSVSLNHQLLLDSSESLSKSPGKCKKVGSFSFSNFQFPLQQLGCVCFTKRPKEIEKRLRLTSGILKPNALMRKMAASLRILAKGKLSTMLPALRVIASSTKPVILSRGLSVTGKSTLAFCIRIWSKLLSKYCYTERLIHLSFQWNSRCFVKIYKCQLRLNVRICTNADKTNVA